jgi:hypothetical protein
MTEPTSAPGALTPARRLQLLREIQGGGYSIRADSSTEALAAAEVKLAEWRELDSLEDIRLRTIHGTIGRAEEVRVVLALLTPSGMRFLQEHAGEPHAPSRIARAR